MTPLEYGNMLLEEGKELNYQQKVLSADLAWIKERLDAVTAKFTLATTIEERNTLEKEMEMIRRKFKLNVEEQTKAQQKLKEFDLKLAAFKGGLGTS